MIAGILRIGVSGLLLGLLLTPQVRAFYFRSGVRWQYIFFLAFFAALFITPIARSLAIQLKIHDKPDWRKRHRAATPLLGGLAVQTAFALALIVNGVFLPKMTVLLTGSTMIFFLGLWDDVRPLKASFRFLCQILVSLYVVFAGDISLTFFSAYTWAPLINAPLTVLWLVGLTNSMNFFDGLDGLASGLAIISAAFLGSIAFLSNQPALGWFAVALVGACLGFIPYNFRLRGPALLFLGDAGSTFLGFTLAGLGIIGQWSVSSSFVSISAPILVFGILIFDMTYVTLSRIKNNRSDGILRAITSPGRDHLHHRLLQLGFLPKEAVFIIFSLSTCFGVSALIIMDQRVIQALLGLGQAILLLGVFVVIMLKGRDLHPPGSIKDSGIKHRQDSANDEN